MRWLKHMTNTTDDEKIADLISRFGHAGYGIWWLVAEAVAKKVDGDSKAEVTYPVSKWSTILSVRGSHVRQCLEKLVVTHLVTVEWTSGDVTVRIPNILKYRDEYSRKSGHTPDSVRSKIQKQNTEADTEAEEPQNLCPPDGGRDGAPHEFSLNGDIPSKGRPKAFWYEQNFVIWYQSYWNKKKRGEARKAYERAINRLVDRDKMGYNAARLFLGSKVGWDQQRFEHTDDWQSRVKLHPSTWLNQELWTDEVQLTDKRGKPVLPMRPTNYFDPKSITG